MSAEDLARTPYMPPSQAELEAIQMPPEDIFLAAQGGLAGTDPSYARPVPTFGEVRFLDTMLSRVTEDGAGGYVDERGATVDSDAVKHAKSLTDAETWKLTPEQKSRLTAISGAESPAGLSDEDRSGIARFLRPKKPDEIPSEADLAAASPREKFAAFERMKKSAGNRLALNREFWPAGRPVEEGALTIAALSRGKLRASQYALANDTNSLPPFMEATMARYNRGRTTPPAPNQYAFIDADAPAEEQLPPAVVRRLQKAKAKQAKRDQAAIAKLDKQDEKAKTRQAKRDEREEALAPLKKKAEMKAKTGKWLGKRVIRWAMQNSPYAEKVNRKLRI